MVEVKTVAKELAAAKTVDEFKQVCKQYYSDGCSQFVECYEDKQIADVIGNYRLLESLIDVEQEEVNMFANGMDW